MNRSQKILTVAALALFCVSVMLSPWANKGAEYKYQAMFFAPRYGYHLQWQNLIVEWLAIGILYGWLFWLFRHVTFKLPRPNLPRLRLPKESFFWTFAWWMLFAVVAIAALLVLVALIAGNW